MAWAAEEQRTRRLHAWRSAWYAAVCDVREPWPHGTILRSTRYPSYFELNLVRLEEPVALAPAELAAVADAALGACSHRLIAFEDADAGEPLWPAFAAAGWRRTRLVWMRHEGAVALRAHPAVEEVSYDEVGALRREWHQEDFPGHDPGDFDAQAREVASARSARVLAYREGAELVGFAQLERLGDAAEVAQVYVRPGHRGAGRGGALTAAATRAAGGARDVWICADDEGRPKRLYGRLGFVPVATTLEFLRVPGGSQARA